MVPEMCHVETSKEPCIGPSVGPIMTILVLGNENDVSIFPSTRGGKEARKRAGKKSRAEEGVKSRTKHWNASARMIVGKTMIGISRILRIGANRAMDDHLLGGKPSLVQRG